MDNEEQKLLRNNPVFIISISIVIAGIMTAVSVLLYLRSDTRKTIEQIRQNNQTSISNEDILPSGKITSESLTAVEKNISEKIHAYDDDADFSPDSLTDAALGL
ncbi:hypothetical protein KC930_03010 [Candidatus Saccharibacteria bacterium]|nr:hypothetical protein [Candidatus Saccharibacteria bacterium]